MFAILFMSLALAHQDPCDGDYESAECLAAYFPCDGVDYESVECLTAQIALATRNLSLPEIRAESDAGAQVYRAVFDGGQSGSPAVSFERRPGRSPEVVVYGTEGRTLHREIGADAWEAVEEQSRYAGRRLARSGGRSYQCYMSSTAVVQIARPRRPPPSEFSGFSVENPPIEASQNSCEGGLTWDYAFFLADLACGEIPECDAMGARDGFGQPAHHLGAVFQLRGDRVAAASLYGARNWPPSRAQHDQPIAGAMLADWLNPEYGATLDWGGSVIEVDQSYDDPEPDAISRFLADRDAETGGLRFEPAEFGADAADVGWVTGTVHYSLQTDGARRHHEATYRQTWLRSGDDWQLWSMTVGAFESRAPRAE